MDVAAYLKELLYQEHYVYVPGLGTFSTRKTAGAYNQGQQRFYPPKNSLDFVAEEKQDETLENYISREKNISKQAARYFIEKFVDELKNNLSTNNLPVKEVLFPAGIEADPENKTVNASFNQENFGLPPITITAIKPTPSETPDFSEKEAVTKQDHAENFNKGLSNNSPEKQEENSDKKSSGLRAAVFLLLGIGVLGCYALYLYNPDIYNRFFLGKKQSAVVAKQPGVDTVKQLSVIEKPSPKDTGTAKASADTIAATTKNTVPASQSLAKDTAATEATDPDLVEKSPYEIIGAAFKTLKGAKNFLNQLKAKGMHYAKILKNTSGKAVLITFGSFQDKETAHAALEKLRAKDVHSEAYIQHYIIK